MVESGKHKNTEDLAAGPLSLPYKDSWEPCAHHLAFLDSTFPAAARG